jgi:hypothetical protein
MPQCSTNWNEIYYDQTPFHTDPPLCAVCPSKYKMQNILHINIPSGYKHLISGPVLFITFNEIHILYLNFPSRYPQDCTKHVMEWNRSIKTFKWWTRCYINLHIGMYKSIKNLFKLQLKYSINQTIQLNLLHLTEVFHYFPV